MRSRIRRLQLAAVIITLNEEDTIERCLKSIQWVDEIVVVDSGSMDRTCDIARKYTNRVSYRKFDNFSSQRNYASALTSHNWILYIDADEEVSDLLRQKIECLLSDNPKHTMYAVSRQNIYFGKHVRYVFGDDRPVRLYNRADCRLSGTVHEKVVGGSSGSIDAPLRHYGPKQYTAWIMKHRRYSRLEAMEHFQKGRRFSLLRLWFSPLRVFYFRFISLQGWRDGETGFKIALEMARSTLIYQVELFRLGKRCSSQS